jgi:hypothetical protein
MALVLADRVQEYSTTTGTGTLTLSGAYAGFQTFAAGIGNGNTCYYTITSDTNQWEVGIGTVGVGTLARTTLISSSTGSLVSFVGTLTVFVTYPAEKAIYQDASGNTLVPNLGSTTASAGSFTTLNSSGATRLGGASGNQSLQVNNVASAVNYAQIVGAVTGGAPTISAQGSDANIGLVLSSKGTGVVVLNGTATSRTVQIEPVSSGTTSYMQFTKFAAVNEQQMIAANSANLGLVATGGGAIYFRTADTSQLQAVISGTASAVNYLNLTGAATGAAPTVSAQGSDANINLVLSSKGTGVVALGGSTVANSGVQVAPVASAVNYWTLQGATTGNGLSLAANGTDANIGMGYNSKGGSGHLFNTYGSTLQFYISPTASAVNRIEVTGGATNNPPQVIASGSDTNINLKLTPKGMGVLQFGTYTAGVVAQAGYITITDAGGTSRRLLVG